MVYRRGEGVVLFEPSVAAIDERSGEVLEVGEAARSRKSIGRTPATIRAIRPLRQWCDRHFEVTEQMLRYFIRATSGSRFSAPRVIVCAPSGITEVERRAVEEAALSAGAREAYFD